MHLCPRICNRSPSSSYESPATKEELSPNRPVPGRPFSPSRHLTTPGRRVRVYDDMRSPTHQPQTPDQLPEALHQSILSASYTAPVSRFRTDPTPGRMPMTGRRSQRRRGLSPRGMDTPGFEGLYGGRENHDDVDLFDEADQARNNGSPTPSPGHAA